MTQLFREAVPLAAKSLHEASIQTCEDNRPLPTVLGHMALTIEALKQPAAQVYALIGEAMFCLPS